MKVFFSLFVIYVSFVFLGCNAEIPGNVSPQIWRTVIRQEFWYSLIGLVSGFSTIILGIYLSAKGLLGKIDWIVNVKGIESRLLNATPGVVLFLIGFFIIVFTRYKVKVSKNKTEMLE